VCTRTGMEVGNTLMESQFPSQASFAKIPSTVSFAAGHSPPPLPQRAISRALLPFQFTAQSGANGDTLHHLSHRWWSVLHRLPGQPSKKGLLRTAECQLPLPTCLYQPFLGPLRTGGALPAPPLAISAVPAQLAYGMRMALIPSTQQRKKPAFSP
jgi:hypothetical protein